ncbi:Syja_N domain-containing protein [Xylariaceae sp. FL0594]|nr:Syja_N domain-containing protein [Xylariaceae sp. FL0594]
MPGLARKLLIFAAVDGLIIQPLSTKGGGARGQQRSATPVKVKYGDATVTTVPRDQVATLESNAPKTSFEAFGVIGLFTVARLSYLVTITGRKQVAQIRGFPVYVVTDVALTPCKSQGDAETAIAHTADKQRRASADKSNSEASDTESEVDVPAATTGADDTDDPGALSDRESSELRGHGDRAGIAEDVYKRRGSYGRVARKWFSNKGWMATRRQSLGLSGVGAATVVQDADEESEEAEAQSKSKVDKELSSDVVQEKVETPPAPTAGESLIPKLLRTAHIYFGTSKSFFFSYDVDLTRSTASRRATAMNRPLHEVADPTFFWNRHLLEPFTDLGDDSLLLPMIQGFVGQRSFVVDQDPPQIDSQLESMELNDMTTPPPGSPPEETPSAKRRSTEKEYLLTVVSRRSVNRAGLRYLRRGVDEDGFAANSVETEQILSTPSWAPTSKLYSFVQARGSIPLFFTQSPWSLKPIPVLQHSKEANFRAFSKHFGHLGDMYGSLQLVNLVEKHGVESIIGNEYQRNVEKYNEEISQSAQPLDFEWFDFHSACRGMKFENVSQLLDTLGEKIQKMGSSIELDGELQGKQNGVLRTNCMDCLDRTNVCQSSFGKFMLDAQLKDEGIDMSAQLDQVNSWFNTLWADNGDAISKQYASTAAMKGDYTRTRKRDYRGMVNDLGLSLTRFYSGMVNDYFSQAAIDFFLGNVSSLVFDEFEATMRTKDPSVSMSKMRELAIETSQKIAIEDQNEDFIGGWTLLSPRASDTIKAVTFEEVVLLLTDVALYLCRFDWNLDKVSSFERVELSHVTGIKIGTYITSTMSAAQTDESKNVGMVVTYEPGKTDIKRTNTRSLSSMSGQAGSTNSGSGSGSGSSSSSAAATVSGIISSIAGSSGTASQTKNQTPRKLALKAISVQSAIRRDGGEDDGGGARGRDKDRRKSGEGGKRVSEMQQIELIAAEIERLVLVNQPRPPAPPENADADAGADEGKRKRKKEGIIEREDIISLEEARKATGLLEQLGHTIKKFVWA